MRRIVSLVFTMLFFIASLSWGQGTVLAIRPPAPPTALAATYVQGPTEIFDPCPPPQIRCHLGPVKILMNAGYCCDLPKPWGTNWEGLFVYQMPLNGYPAAWEQLAVANLLPDGTWTTTLDEHEMGFPTSVYWQGYYYVAYTATRHSTIGQKVRANVGLLKASSLTHGGVISRQIEWIRPINPNPNWPTGTLGAFSTAFVLQGTTLYLYVTDTTLVDQPSKSMVVRYRINSDMSYVLDAYCDFGRDQQGNALRPSIDDMGFGTDGAMYALETVWPQSGIWWQSQTDRQWKSVAGTPTSVGLTWSLTTATYTAPPNYVFDGGFNRTSVGQIGVPPLGVITNYSTDGGDPHSNSWQLMLWPGRVQ